MKIRPDVLVTLCLLLGGALCCAALASDDKPPISAYLLDQAEEIALARSAAPTAVSRDASILVLHETGYDKVKTGSNGFTCLLQRSWCNPTAWGTGMFWNPRIRVPICYNPEATRSVLPDYLLRTELVLAGRSMEEIDAEVRRAYGSGKLRPPGPGALGYMFSSGQWLGPAVGAFRPHMMIYMPYMTDTEAGGFPLGSRYPHVFIGAGRPDAALVIPVPELDDPGEPHG